MVEWTRQGQVAHVPPLLVQPVAAADVGTVLAEVATGDPLGRAIDLAGRSPRIWWTWFGARWRRAASRSG